MFKPGLAKIKRLSTLSLAVALVGASLGVAFLLPTPAAAAAVPSIQAAPGAAACAPRLT